MNGSKGTVEPTNRRGDSTRASLDAWFRCVGVLSFYWLGSMEPAAVLGQAWTANPDAVARLARAGINYDEQAVPDLTLPDPLLRADGRVVAEAEHWNERRLELLELFRSNVYGRRPADSYTVSFSEHASSNEAHGGLATGIEVVATVCVETREYTFPFIVLTPRGKSGPHPAIVHINNREFVSLDRAISENKPFWPSKTILERGYAVATVFTSDVDPDNPDEYLKGVRAFFAEGRPPTDESWGSLSAWGWAASQVREYLASKPQVDGDRIAVVGHSRGGKAALWAAGEDTRFAIAFSNNSGCGGAALSRRAYGETVGQITSRFPHWFCRNFARYADRESGLPVDQHQVLALTAPRGLYVASADEDLWADPRGEYLSLQAASPVYKLLGADAISDPNMPPLNNPRVRGPTGYHIRSGGHGLGERDWE